MALIAISNLDNTFCEVDDNDYENLIKYKWRCDSKGYAVTRMKNLTSVRMHRFIMKTKDPDMVVDHINHNKLDNRRNNLRVCTNDQNSKNRAISINKDIPYKGVFKSKGIGFYALITNERKRINLGRYLTEKEAAIAYDFASIDLHGDFSCTNHSKKELSKMEKPIPLSRKKRQWECCLRRNNKTGFIGVRKRGNKYHAHFGFNKKQLFLGSFSDAKDAAMARDAKAIELRGENAPLNFPISNN